MRQRDSPAAGASAATVFSTTATEVAAAGVGTTGVARGRIPAGNIAACHRAAIVRSAHRSGRVTSRYAAGGRAAEDARIDGTGRPLELARLSRVAEDLEKHPKE